MYDRASLGTALVGTTSALDVPLPGLSDRDSVAGGKEAIVLDAEMVEVALLLPRGQAAALTSVAEQQGLTAGQLLRRLIRNLLAIESRHAATPIDGCICP